MRPLTGSVYIATGVLCDFVYTILVGAMLGMTTPIYSASGLFIAPLLSIGPSLLILTGVATLFERARRSILCLITSIVATGGLAVWTVPRIGWRDAAWFLLEPEAGSFLIASLILLVLKKRWVAAVVACVTSAPFFLYGTGHLVHAHLFGTAIFSWTEIWLVGPSALIVFSFVLAMRARIP